MNKKIKVISCILTVAVMALIFFFSSQNSTESSEVSSGVTKELVEFFVGLLHLPDGNEAELVDMLHNFVRKTAHFSIFAALGFTSSFAFLANTSKRGRDVFLAAVIFSMLYAVSDELHQLFVGGRACRVFDVFIDTCGAAFGAGIFAALMSIKRRVDYKFDWWITCTVIVMLIIFLFSSQTSDNSNDLSRTVAEWIVGIADKVFGIEGLTVAVVNARVRKAAHFMLYFVLGGTAALMLIKKGGFRVHNAYLIAVIIAAAYAACDEFHQGFVDGRGPLVSDVRLDSFGATAGSVLCAAACRWLSNRKERKRNAVIEPPCMNNDFDQGGKHES